MCVPLIYTIYAGGDDFLLVAPWDTMFDFAGDLRKEFQAGPGQEYQKYGITFSAGIHLTPYRVPIRHAAEQAERLLERAKGQEGKNRCAALGAIWQWDRHDTIIGDGKRLAGWRRKGAGSRSLLHRLLQLADNRPDPDSDSRSPERGLRAARWSYQLARNLPQSPQSRRRDEQAEATAAMRAWAQDVLPSFDEPAGVIPDDAPDELVAQKNTRRLDETAASLRYALMATRSGGGGTE